MSMSCAFPQPFMVFSVRLIVSGGEGLPLGGSCGEEDVVSEEAGLSSVCFWSVRNEPSIFFFKGPANLDPPASCSVLSTSSRGALVVGVTFSVASRDVSS